MDCDKFTWSKKFCATLCLINLKIHIDVSYFSEKEITSERNLDEDICHTRITEALLVHIMTRVTKRFVGDIWACHEIDLSARMKKPCLFSIILVLIRNMHAIKSFMSRVRTMCMFEASCFMFQFWINFLSNSPFLLSDQASILEKCGKWSTICWHIRKQVERFG